MRYCIVTVGTGGYGRGLGRLQQSLVEQGFKGDFLSWTGYPPNSPTHQEVPYAFKLHALAEARRQGYDCALWLDCSIWAVKPVEPIFEIIEKQGYALWDASWQLGQWCHDSGLAKFGISRDNAMKMELVIGGAVGINFNYLPARVLFEDWFECSTDGFSFLGPWRNERCEMGTDPRILGHRHDMPSLTYYARSSGLNTFKAAHLFQYWTDPLLPETVLACHGM